MLGPVAARLAFVIVVLAGCGGSGEVRLTVTPRDGLLDAPLNVRATGLHEPATLTVTTPDAEGRKWTASAPYRLGDASLVLSSMLPTGFRGDPNRIGFAPPTKGVVELTIKTKGHVQAHTTVVRRVASPGVSVRETTLRRVGFVGYFCTGPRKSGPAILMLGGSEGGLPSADSCQLLASHGYPTLALAYFGVSGLPPNLTRIPLEYFAHALRWLTRRPGVNPDKVVVWGGSRGGEAALLIAATYPHIVHGAIGYVPSAFVIQSPSNDGPAWTLRGTAIPFMTLNDANAQEDAIKVERISGPVFVVGAGDDALWPSQIFVTDIAVRMREHGRNDVTALTYRNAGHGVGLALPNIRTRTILPSRRYGTIFLGGSPEADARARAASWPKLLAFLQAL